MTTVLILIVSTVIGAGALWYLNRVIASDGLGHRPPPRSHRSEQQSEAPLWYADTRSTGINWPYSEARRSIQRLQARH